MSELIVPVQRVPRGYRFAGVHCGVRKTSDVDLALVVSEHACSAAAVFTSNRFAAAPVLYDRALVQERPAELRAVVVNAGVANACTGEDGYRDAAQTAAAAEEAIGLPQRTCAVMSTGVIGPRLPMDRILTGIRLAVERLDVDGWDLASHAIMTTDTRPKTAWRQVGECALFGMAKGSGMIHPDMATLLAIVVTDAAVEPDLLAAATREAVDTSFNAISVDGDTSTNDTLLVMANGAAGPVDTSAFSAALSELCADLAQQIVRDGEGATKFIAIRIEDAATTCDARRAAKAVANSPLVKTAFYGGDANWGRILAAVGYSGAAVVVGSTELWIGRDRDASLQLVSSGRPLAYSEAEASAIFAAPEITVVVRLGAGSAISTVWTCDLSHDYVSINGHYRT